MPWPLDALIVFVAAVQPAQPPATAPAIATASDPAAPAPSEDQQVAQSASIGKLLYTFDRAAWVSTDALLKKVPRDQLGGPGGYVVEPIGTDMLQVTYYRGEAAAARAFFIADIRKGKVVRDALVAEPVALTPRQAALAAARTIATDAAMTNGYKPCTPAPFNTVVLPSHDGGPIAVYLLSAQKNTDSYPMGGHYRVIVGPDGKVLASRPFSASCLTIELPKSSRRGGAAILFVTHLLDPVPTEIHAFTSHSLRAPLVVGTSETRVWEVSGSKIVAIELDR